jgi:hypothetical protein
LDVPAAAGCFAPAIPPVPLSAAVALSSPEALGDSVEEHPNKHTRLKQEKYERCGLFMDGSLA